MGRINGTKEKKLLDDETLTFEKSISVKAMRLPRRQKRVVHELRRLNATILDASVINADDTTTFNLHQKINARMAKIQKDFTCTLVVCDSKMLLVNESQGVKRQCTKGPKKYDTEQSSIFMIIEEDQWDTKFSASEVDTSSDYSFEFQWDAVKEDTDQEVNANPELELNIKQGLDQELQLIFIPMPREGFVCLCQWKYFLAAFQSENIYVWVVEMETHVFMAVTTHNATPPVYEAISVVNIRYAINQGALPLLAVQLLTSGWQNANANDHVVGMQAMQGYWQIKPLEGNLRHIARSQISACLLVNVEQVGEKLPTLTRGDMPMPEKAPHSADSPSEPEPKSQVDASLISLDAAISYSSIRDQLLKLIPMKKNDIEEKLLSTIEIFDSDEEDLLEITKEPTTKNVNMDNQNPVEAVPSPLSLSQDVFAKELTSIEYLNSGDIMIPKVENNTNQNEVSIGSEGAGTVPVFKHPANPIANSPDQGLTNPAPEILPKQDKYLAGKIVSKVIHLDPSAPWCLIQPLSANSPDNKEFQSNASEKQELQINRESNRRAIESNKSVPIFSEKQELQSITEVKVAADKQELQSNETVTIGIKRTVSGMVQLPTPNTFLAQKMPAGYIRLLPKMSVPPNSAAGSQPQQPSVIPRKAWRIYPIAHMPVNSEFMQKQQAKSLIATPVPTTGKR